MRDIPSLPRLPSELWGLVFDVLLDPLGREYNYCTFDTFPAYQARQAWTSLIGDEERRSLLTDCLNLRLTCRSWYMMTTPIRAIAVKPSTPLLLPGLQSIKLNQSVGELQHLFTLTEVTVKITTITFMNPPSRDSGFACDFLLDNAGLFPTLRSLSLGYAPTRLGFWERLQAAFPRLVSLTIRDRVDYPGRLTLNDLQILDITWPREDVQFRFPSLKHCSVIRVPEGSEERMGKFLDAQLGGLESLFLPRSYWIAPSSQSGEEWLWRSSPNLKTLGIDLQQFQLMQGPPPNHPLVHLRLFLPSYSREESSLLIDQVQQRILLSPQIRRLSVDYGRLSRPECKALQRVCEKHGIELLMVPAPAEPRRRSLGEMIGNLPYSMSVWNR